MRLLTRLLRRLLILGLGVVSVWLIVFVVFDFPLLLALSLTYAVAAYIILPRAVRMGLKGPSAQNGCQVRRSQATDYPVTRSTSCSSGHLHSSAPPMRPQVGQRLTGWVWRAPGAWPGHSS